MRFAYADPPYPGCAHLYGPDAREVNHALLIRHLADEYPDGWALSTSSVALAEVLPLCPAGTRIGAWVKPFCSWKFKVNPAYTWEPVLFAGGRPLGNFPKVRDHVAASITLKKGLTGVKPYEFCVWIFELLGMEPGDELADIFPGSGAVTRAWDAYSLSIFTRPAVTDDPHLIGEPNA